ncbi:uncharacterized protein LOC129943997 [Eupeodes corollae]|uniref:uncharacterized protein LOC129943997 n=1 Tax=Eupeodes corollae TaxID=290404 RepID=UPI002491A11A|nr:uncharacterized protein LOC129943997 [Eupeodes corollae]
MATEASSYLDSKFFHKALEEGFRELGIIIQNIEVVDAGIGGDNYCSTIFRAKIGFQRGSNGSPENISLIVKSMPNVNYGFLERLQVYAKEKVFYMDIMHRMEVLLPRKILILGAKHFYSTTDPVQTIVLEDLTSNGFELQSRQLGLDEDHSALVLTKLGQFHALSMVLMEKDKTIGRKFQKGLLHEEAIMSGPFVGLFGAQLKKLAAISTEWEGFEGISHKLFRFCEHFSKNVMRAVFPLEGFVNVLNHGDLWVNNLLFKRTEGDNSIDMRMIDFQFSFCGSPGFDLNYFFYTSLQLDVLKTKRDQLIEIYYQSLRETLKELQHDFIPSLEDIQNEIFKKELYGFFVSFAFFPMMSMHKEDSVDNSLEGMQNSEIAKKKIELMFTTNKRTLETLRYVLERFDEIGILDFYIDFPKMKIIDESGLDIPNHLTVQFFQKTLLVGFNLSRVTIHRIVFSPGCDDGDSFTSLIYRARVRYSTDDNDDGVLSTKWISFIIKVIPVEGDRKIFKIMDVFKKEINMYEKVLPEVEKMLASENISGQMVPRMIYKQDHPVGTIVFEDLNELQLGLANRCLGLNQSQAKMVLTKIGQFHAATMILARDQPEVMDLFSQPTIDKNAQNTVRDSVFRSNIEVMADLVENWDGFKNIARKLRNVKNDFYDRVTKCVHNKEAFKVLNHGDLWVNNCMFKHSDEGDPENLLFIDFQLSYYGSPIFDLHYFLNTSLQLDVLNKKRNVLLLTYYQALRSTLKTLNYPTLKIPTWDQFSQEVMVKEFIGFWAFEAFLPLLTIDKTASTNNRIESFNNEDEARKKREVMFSSERFLETIRYSLPYFDKLGVLD